LFLPESLQNLTNSKPRLLFSFLPQSISYSQHTHTHLCFNKRTDRNVSSFEVNGKPGPGSVMSSGREQEVEMFQMENSGPSSVMRAVAGHRVSKHFSVSLLARPQTQSQLWLQYQGVASWLFTVKLVGSGATSLLPDAALAPLQLRNVCISYPTALHLHTRSAKKPSQQTIQMTVNCTLRDIRQLVPSSALDGVLKLQKHVEKWSFYRLFVCRVLKLSTNNRDTVSANCKPTLTLLLPSHLLTYFTLGVNLTPAIKTSRKLLE